MIISESQINKIVDAINQSRILKEREKNEKRWKEYHIIFASANEERNNLGQVLATRRLVRCRDCFAWCKRTNREIIMWPMASEGKVCPLCQSCKLTRASIV